MTIAKPFLKWAGGKSSLLPEMLPRLPAKIKTYYEPFVGGGAVFFALAAEKRFDHAVINDSNEDLMSAYATVGDQVDAVVRKLEEHAESHGKTYFYAVRSTRTASRVSSAARLIYLNRTCFNGLYRVNKSGEFNVPFGDYKNPTICNEEGLRAAAKVLERTVVSALDFEDVVMPAKRGDAVYFDPPYFPVSATSNFTAYAKDGFTADDHERLRNTAEKLVAKGAHVLLSNSDTPFVRELYCSFKIEEVSARRNINSKGGKRGAVGEVLISGRNQ